MLDMVLLTIQMSQYYEGMLDISKYIFLMEDAQCKAARARLPILPFWPPTPSPTQLSFGRSWILPTRPGLPGR
jgi:hypothetical protein